MIYSVYCDDQLIYNPYLDDYYFLSSDLKIVDNAIGTFSFVVDDSHVAYTAVSLKRSKIKIYRDADLFWMGRPDEVQHSLDGTFVVYCSFCLSYFKDTIMRPFSFSGSPAEFFAFVIGVHNEQVEQGKKFIIGDCTVTDPNDYIVRSSEGYEKTWEIIKSRMINSLGGHLIITYNENEEPVISWLSEITDYCSQDIVFGENLVDYAKGLLYDGFCTAIIPLGAELEDGSRLTIASVNDNVDYIYDSTLVETYGFIYADVDKTTWDDVTVASNLLSKAQDWLTNNGIKYKSSVTLSAEDISVLNAEVDAFLPLKMVRFILSDGTILTYLITEYDCDIVNGEDLNIVLHDQETQYVSLALGSSNARTNAENIERIKNIEANYVTGERVATITEQVLEESTLIEQKCNEIIAEVVQRYLTIEAYEGYEQAILEEISSKVTQMAEELRIDFASSINTTGQNAQNQFDAIYSFVRIIAQTSTVNGGLVLGESTSSIKAKLENDVLYFFSVDETTVSPQNAIAYFAAGKLYVNEVQINRLTVGQTGQLMYFTIIGEGDNRCLFLSGRLV